MFRIILGISFLKDDINKIVTIPTIKMVIIQEIWDRGKIKKSITDNNEGRSISPTDLFTNR